MGLGAGTQTPAPGCHRGVARVAHIGGGVGTATWAVVPTTAGQGGVGDGPCRTRKPWCTQVQRGGWRGAATLWTEIATRTGLALGPSRQGERAWCAHRRCSVGGPSNTVVPCGAVTGTGGRHLPWVAVATSWTWAVTQRRCQAWACTKSSRITRTTARC